MKNKKIHAYEKKNALAYEKKITLMQIEKK